jgi:hypothetical protein
MYLLDIIDQGPGCIVFQFRFRLRFTRTTLVEHDHSIDIGIEAFGTIGTRDPSQQGLSTTLYVAVIVYSE